MSAARKGETDYPCRYLLPDAPSKSAHHRTSPCANQKWHRRSDRTSTDGRRLGRFCASSATVQRVRPGLFRLRSIRCPVPHGQASTAHFAGDPTR
jgi:hypothetical protein